MLFPGINIIKQIFMEAFPSVYEAVGFFWSDNYKNALDFSIE